MNKLLKGTLVLFFGLNSISFYSQNPGNVGTLNLTAWFKPDLLPNGNVTAWTTAFSSLGPITVTDAAAPYPQATNVPPGNISNYNTTLEFSNNTSTNLQSLTNPNTLDLLQNFFNTSQGTFFGTYYLPSTSTSTNDHMMLFNRAPHAIQFRNMGAQGRIAIGQSASTSLNASRTYTEDFIPTIVSYQGNRSAVATMRAYERGILFPSVTASQSSGPTGLYFGNYPGIATAPYNGYLHEFIFFDRDLTVLEMSKVHTYLAIKYGVNMDNIGGGVNGDYTATNGTIIWDASVNPPYHNNVIGIGRDDSEGLLQKQSHAFNDSYRVYVGALTATNVANTGIVNADVSYITMGHLIASGCATAASNAEAPAGVEARIAKEWKVTNTNFNQNFSVDIKIDTCQTTGFVVGNVLASNIRLLVDTDGNFIDAAIHGPASGLTFSYSNGYVTVNGISPALIPVNSTNYITLAYATPIAYFTGNQTICNGQSAAVTVNILNSTGPIDIQYSDGTTTTTLTNATNGQIINLNPTVTTTYTVFGLVNFLKCCGTSVDSVFTITVNALPIVGASATPTTICLGATTQLTGSGAATYTWNNGGNNTGNTTPSATTNYTVTGTASNGCISTANVTVTVNAVPVVTAASSATAVCAGTSITLNGGGATSYSWNNGATNNVAVIPAATTNYTVTGTGANGCTNTASVMVTINSLPVVTANAAPANICTGGSTTLNGGGASTYTWNNGVTNNVAFIPASTTTYTVTGTNANGCINTANVTVTVNALPTVVANASMPTICLNSTSVLTGSGATTYTWNNGATNGGSVSPATNTTYTVTGTNSNGCVNTANVTINVNPLPVVTAASSATTVCAGTSITLNGGGTISYTWNNGATNNVAVIPAATTNYTVTGTNANGCTNTASVLVTVNSLPVVTANAAPANVCTGGSTTLNGGGATSYTWNNGVTNNVAYTPAATTSYTVTGTDANGCFNTANVTVTVNALPTVVANAGSTTICDNTTTALNGSGANTYTWDNGATNGGQVGPAANTTYTVTGTDINGCINTASVSINVNPSPTVTASSSNTNFCSGGSVTLTGGGANTYVWNNGVMDNVPFSPTITTTYTVVGSNGFGCINSASTTVNVFPLPTVQANSSKPGVCQGQSAILSGAGAVTYTWDNGVTNGISFIPSATNSYTVTGTNANGCVNTATISVPVFPNVAFSLGADDTICPQNPILLTANAQFASYLWSTGSTSSYISVSQKGTYVLTVIDANGCSYTDAQTISIGNDCYPVIFIPNAFTPNHDEYNTYFRTSGDNIDKFEIKIFNRWGEVMFISKDINEPWDGTYAGKVCPDGIYNYVVNYTTNAGNDEKLQLKGNVTILR